MSNERDLVKELFEKIHQLILHQLENNSDLPESSRESLFVASECIQQSYNIEKKPASSELLNIYKTHKQQPSGSRQQSAQNPAAFLQNMATTFLNNFPPAGASATGAGSHSGERPHTATSASDIFSSPPRLRKNATDSEKMAAESFKTQGNELMRSEQYREAYESYTRAIEIDDNNAIYYSNRAAASSKLSDHQAAIKDCKEAIAIDPTYSKAYGRMGLAFATLNDHHKAREAYKKAVELDPSNESYRNNLLAAEEKINEQSRGGAGINPFQVLSSLMNNPMAAQMAMSGIMGFAGQGQHPQASTQNNPDQQSNPNPGNQQEQRGQGQQATNNQLPNLSNLFNMVGQTPGASEMLAAGQQILSNPEMVNSMRNLLNSFAQPQNQNQSQSQDQTEGRNQDDADVDDQPRPGYS